MPAISVLIVDMDADYSDALSGRLTACGLMVQTASSADAVLAEINKKKIDVVLLDAAMTKPGGIEMLKQIKALDPLVEVILLAGEADLSVAIRAMESGAFDFLFKLVELDDLVYALDNAYQKKILQEQKINKIRSVMNKTKQGGAP